jgi:hypothetical protein
MLPHRVSYTSLHVYFSTLRVTNTAACLYATEPNDTEI